MRQPHSSLVIWIQLKHCQDPPFGARVCVRGMRWGRDPIRLPKTPLEKNGYALGMRQPHSSLVIWIRPGSRQIPFGARACVRGMRWGRDPIGLPKPSLEKKKRICTRYAPATFIARHLDPAGTRPGSCILLESIWSPGMRQGYALVKPRPQPRQSASRQKNRYALGMRLPHCPLGIWIHAEHGLDSARTLVSFRYLCAGGMRPYIINIYIYTPR